MTKPMKHKDGKTTVPSKEFKDNWDRIFTKTCDVCGEKGEDLIKVSITRKAFSIKKICKKCKEKRK